MSVKNVSDVGEVEPVVSVLASAFVDDPSLVFLESMTGSRDTSAQKR